MDLAENEQTKRCKLTHYRLVYRGHFGGLLGGAAVAWALGPRYVQVRSFIVVLAGCGLMLTKQSSEIHCRPPALCWGWSNIPVRGLQVETAGRKPETLDRPPVPLLAWPENA